MIFSGEVEAIQVHGCVPYLYSTYDMGLHYLTFMGRNLENRYFLMMVHITNSAGTNSKNIVNIVSAFNDIVSRNSYFNV